MQQYYGAAKQIFSDEGVKQFIIGDIIDALNNHIKTYLMKMGAEFTVYFDNNLYYEFLQTIVSNRQLSLLLPSYHFFAMPISSY